MSTQGDFDIIIVGGGMAGLAQALALSALGLRIALIDSQPSPSSSAVLAERMDQATFADRVSALTPASIRFLSDLGVWPAVSELRVSPYRKMCVWDADGSGKIEFSADALHLDSLGSIVENEVLTCVLAEAAAQEQALSLYFEHKVEGINSRDGLWEIALESGDLLSCSLLIGADGGFSRVREWAGFALREWSYQQQALVCTVRSAKSHQDTAWQRFMPTGPLAYLPLALPNSDDKQYSSIVWSCDESLAQELMSLDPASFALRLEQALESRLGQVEVLSKPQCFPLQQRHAKDYVKAGLALVGDAAHIIHPLAGQGINLGFADVEVLARVIKHAVTRGEDFASLQVLSRFQRERKPENLSMMLTMEAFKRSFGSKDLTLRFLRNQGLKLADRFTPMKHQLMKHAMGLNT